MVLKTTALGSNHMPIAITGLHILNHNKNRAHEALITLFYKEARSLQTCSMFDLWFIVTCQSNNYGDNRSFLVEPRRRT
jgi:hypothetical protein